MSEQKKRTFKVFLYVNFKSEYVIYLVECILCNIEYGGKAESIIFNAKLNNHKKDTKKLDSILLCKHFQQQEHNFDKHYTKN